MFIFNWLVFLSSNLFSLGLKGALKKAAVGVSIISIPEAEKKQREVVNGIEKLKRKERGVRKGDGTGSQKTKTAQNSERKKNESLRKILFEVDSEISQVSLGFASVASPFTART